MKCLVTAAVIHDSNGNISGDKRQQWPHLWCRAHGQHFRAHGGHTHGAERTHTYRAHTRVYARTPRARTRVHVHIPCTHTPSACISDFDPFLKIGFGSTFVFVSARLGSYAPELCWEPLFWGVYGFNWRPTLRKLTGVWPRGVGFIHLKVRCWASGAPGGVRWIFQLSGGVADCVPVAAVVCEIAAKTRLWCK